MKNDLFCLKMEIFVERLKELMLDYELSVSLLAQKLTVNKASVYRYVSGKQFPNHKISILLADTFHCSLDYLFGLSDDVSVKDFRPCPPFSERLNYVLNYFNASKYSVFTHTDVKETSIFKWNNGSAVPSIENIARLAVFLGCSMDFVVGRSE